MRFFLLGIMLSIAAPAAALIRTPSRGDLERIDLMIADANTLEAELSSVKRRIGKLEAELEDPLEPGEAARKRRELVAKKARAAALPGEISHAYDSALMLALDATMAADPWPVGTSYAEPFWGQSVSWTPFYGPNANLRWTGPDKRSDVVFPRAVDKRTGKEPIARTLPNGITVFHPSAFTSAEELILTVVHEQRHFTLNNTRANREEKTSAEREVECYGLEISVAEEIQWRDPAHKEKYLEALGQKLAEKTALAAEQRRLKEEGKFAEAPDVRPAPGLRANITPILARAEEIRKSVSEASVRSLLFSLEFMAQRECSDEAISIKEFDSYPALDRRYYEKEKLRFSGRVLVECGEVRYLNYMTTLASGQRIIPLPRALPPMRSPFPPPTAPLPSPPGPEAPRVLVPYRGEENLRQLIKEICASPSGFTRPSPWMFDWFPQPTVRLSLQRTGDGRCEEALGMHVMEQNQAGNKLDLDDLARRAALYRPSPIIPPPGQAPPGGCGPANPGTDIIGCPTPR